MPKLDNVGKIESIKVDHPKYNFIEVGCGEVDKILLDFSGVLYEEVVYVIVNKFNIVRVIVNPDIVTGVKYSDGSEI